MDRKTENYKTVIRFLGKMVLYFACVFGLTYLLVHFVGQRTVVIGDSMRETLMDGDNVIVDKISYRFKKPKRFDIIVFPNGDNENYIKRIIAMPGEKVYIDEEGIIFIDGEELEESYGREVIRDAGLAGKQITLASDEYFVLGDNRNNSVDSREVSVGNIKEKEIIGRAWVRIYPFDKIKML